MLSMLLAFFGVCIGLCVLLVAMAIMNGFDKDFKQRFFVMNYPLTIMPKFYSNIDDHLIWYLRQEFPNLHFSPYISTQVIAKGDNGFEGGLLFGVHFEEEKKINEVVKEALKDRNLSDFDILIGQGLKEEFRLNFNDKLPIIFSNLNPSGLALIPQTKRFDVKASFRSGLLLYDKAYMYADIKALRKVLNYPEIYDGVHVFSKDAMADLPKIKAFLGESFSVFGWWEQNANLFSALELEKRALFIVLMLIILVASLNIVSSLLMIVMNRRSEIALLLALGASKAEVKKSFFTLGTLIGGGGMIAGVILAFLTMWVLGNFDIIELPADVYGSSKLPLDLSLSDFLLTLVGASLIVAFSSYYPAKKATQVDVLDALRNE
ncbi:ABC transporter permease [Campylobacter sp. MIT 99-7217]|uniref:ABC transporter permease n=1 Tax=Campylobacter sp. MIT 99-7217 TaxID=535091 RepID=UPI0021B07EBB|nr:ABC transporter permease [Campylobacter sp. MIT 99-7217]